MRQTALRSFGLGLGAICRAYHYRAPENTAPGYAVWQEIAGGAVEAENRHAEDSFEIALDYFTKTEFDENIDAIEAFLQGFGSWTLESVQFEYETGYIHYEWRIDYA